MGKCFLYRGKHFQPIIYSMHDKQLLRQVNIIQALWKTHAGVHLLTFLIWFKSLSLRLQAKIARASKMWKEYRNQINQSVSLANISYP